MSQKSKVELNIPIYLKDVFIGTVGLKTNTDGSIVWSVDPVGIGDSKTEVLAEHTAADGTRHIIIEY